ncbi:MAG: ubiquinol-cytochrome C chaperone family protein [Pacificimonas sp.]
MFNLFRRKEPHPETLAARAAYGRVIERARAKDWYVAGSVPDTLDGRFDLAALMLSLLTIRLEEIDTPASRSFIRALTEQFVDDMDASLREHGIGDMVIGKHMGKSMSAYGGRLGAYRKAGEGDVDWREALARNLYRRESEAAADAGALDWAVRQVEAERARLAAIDEATILKGTA